MSSVEESSNPQIYYFPPCGFGFWYLLGIYETIKNDNNILIGASAGSLICVCSLLKKEDLINTVIKCAEETKTEYNKKTVLFYNFYNITYLFLDKLFNYIDKEKLEDNLKNIRIQTAEISGLIHIVKHQIEPRTLNHLRELVLASCYIPVLSNYNNLLYYIVDGKKMCDGILVDLYMQNTHKTFDVTKYKCLTNLLMIPSHTKIMNMYNDGIIDGLLYKKQFNKQFNKQLISCNYYFVSILLIVCYYILFYFKIF